MSVNDVLRDRASLALALSSDIEFIAIVKASPGAVSDPKQSFRLVLLGGITGNTEEEKMGIAYDQATMKSRPWEHTHMLYRLEPVQRPK